MMLEACIRKRYGTFQLDASFTVESGASLALLGASGCGKSVTLRCLAGIDRPDAGRITLDGRVLFDSEKKISLPPQKRKIGYLFQQYALFPHMTVAQNISVSLRHLKKSEQRAQVEKWVALLRLEGMENLLPRQLSGGQQQRTALARILASEPEVILLDEPLSALDGNLKDQLEAELREALAQFGGPVIWVSHDIGEVYRSCRRVCVLDRGKSSPVRTFPELLAEPLTVSAAKISGCRSFTAARAGQEPALAEAPEWGLVLRTAKPWRDGAAVLGVHENCVHPASGGEENRFLCRVRQCVEDLTSMRLELEPESAAAGAPPLRMRVDKAFWRNMPERTQLWVFIRPEDVLLLEENVPARDRRS